MDIVLSPLTIIKLYSYYNIVNFLKSYTSRVSILNSETFIQ